MRKAISSDLGEAALRLVVVVYMLEGRSGGWTRELLEWVQGVVERYAGPNPKDSLLAGVAAILKRTDIELAQCEAHLKTTTQPQFIPLQELSYTTRVIHELHDHDPEYSIRILDVLSHLGMLNEAREDSLYFRRLTFDSGLSSENQKRAMAAVSEAEKQMTTRARIIVDKITEIDKKFGK